MHGAPSPATQVRSVQCCGVLTAALVRQVYPNSTALVISTENITQNWYFGNDRSMLIPNCLFRVGGAAVLLSNKRSDRRRAKCALLSPGRTALALAAACPAYLDALLCMQLHVGVQMQALMCLMLPHLAGSGTYACDQVVQHCLNTRALRWQANADTAAGKQVRAQPCGAHAHGRIRQLVRLRVPEGGHRRCYGCAPRPAACASHGCLERQACPLCAQERASKVVQEGCVQGCQLAGMLAQGVGADATPRSLAGALAAICGACCGKF